SSCCPRARSSLARRTLGIGEFLLERLETTAGLHGQLVEHVGVAREEAVDARDRVLVAGAEVAGLQVADDALLVDEDTARDDGVAEERPELVFGVDCDGEGRAGALNPRSRDLR